MADMDNLDYMLKYRELYLAGVIKFNPTPCLGYREYQVVVTGLTSRLRCPRLPRVGERVVVRSHEEAAVDVAWSRKYPAREVVGVGDLYGVPVEVVTGAGDTLGRTGYLVTWRYAPGSGPKEVLS